MNFNVLFVLSNSDVVWGHISAWEWIDHYHNGKNLVGLAL